MPLNPDDYWSWRNCPHRSCWRNGRCIPCSDALKDGYLLLEDDEWRTLRDLTGMYASDQREYVEKLKAKYIKSPEQRVVEAASSAIAGSKYACAKTAPPGGSKCYKCGEMNEYAGANCAHGYLCYRCR